jgi:hypothetical protein
MRLAPAFFDHSPTFIAASSGRARWFFTANIRNPHARRA